MKLTIEVEELQGKPDDSFIDWSGRKELAFNLSEHQYLYQYVSFSIDDHVYRVKVEELKAVLRMLII